MCEAVGKLLSDSEMLISPQPATQGFPIPRATTAACEVIPPRAVKTPWAACIPPTSSGEVSARLLLLSLAITPLRLFFSESAWPNWLLQRRRYFGVAAFVYAVMHTLVYLERKVGSGLLLQEAAEFSMWTGWLALVIFVPLAITSNDASVRRLRRAWKKLHRWVYLAALLTFTHWIFIAFDFVPGLIHFMVLLVLQTYRIWKRRQLKLLLAAPPAEIH